MIDAKDVSLRYHDDTMALNNINLQIESGELVYITGPSGSGKTSLIKLFMGIEYPTIGYLKILGQTVSKDHVIEIKKMRMRIGPVFQEFKLIKGRTAIENIMLGMRFLDFSYNQIIENASIALTKVGLEHKTHSLVENLSWGECQRIAIARAVARKPTLILADEPTGNLDHDNALKILELLTSFRDEKTTVIITTHATHLIENDDKSRLIQVEGGNITNEGLGLT